MKPEFMRIGLLFLLMIVFTSSKETQCVNKLKYLAIPVPTDALCCSGAGGELAVHDLVMPMAGFILLQ